MVLMPVTDRVATMPFQNLGPLMITFEEGTIIWDFMRDPAMVVRPEVTSFLLTPFVSEAQSPCSYGKYDV